MELFEEYTQMQTLNLLLELEENIPNTIHAYSYVKTHLEWAKKRPDMKNFLLAPLGNASDATFFLYTLSEQSDGKTRLDGTIHSLTKDGAKRLGKALMSKLRILLNENSAFLFTSLSELTRPELESALSSVPIRFGITKCTLYWMPYDKAACLKPRSPKERSGNRDPIEKGVGNDVINVQIPNSSAEVNPWLNFVRLINIDPEDAVGRGVTMRGTKACLTNSQAPFLST